MEPATPQPPEAADALAYESPRAVAVPAAEIGALALRLLGVKLIVDTLSALPWIAMLAFGARGAAPLASTLVGMLGTGALAAALLCFARPVAAFVCGPTRLVLSDVGVGAWMTLIVSGIGLALALFAGGDLATLLTRGGVRSLLDDPTRYALAEVIASAAKVAIGVLLFLRPSLLVLPWLRHAAR